MKKHFGFSRRTRLAHWALKQARAFAALIAPWLAQPGDLPMRASTVIVVVIMVLLALLVGVMGTSMVIRTAMFSHEREETAP